ncbi:MAG TPA: decarboxylating NADP(+)-dependent phosphogluconate dehydrogenase [Trueperaceae bacterium]|nr:decarboxylating NADP(+)-dependent phosphogluconate dehydrogenase [Trueperaceae bacterium]
MENTAEQREHQEHQEHQEHRGPRADIGLVGLAVMGQNLVLNMSDHGYEVAVYNRSPEVTDAFLQGPAAGRAISGHYDYAGVAASLKRPRRVMLMVKAGAPVDSVIGDLLPHLEPGDIIIDGGNSHFTDTIRRTKELREAGLHFIGAGVSGGEEGARHGPSIMPGGDIEAWPHVKKIFQDIAAKVDGIPCCDWVGSDGAGHYVKMVHNGIEYGDMQLISEVYAVMSAVLGMKPAEIAAVFAGWDKGKLDSYLIEITAEILAFEDEDGAPLVDKVLDVAGQKGTGKWTSTEALDRGVPLTLISEAVFARYLSALKDERVAASRVLAGPSTAPRPDERDLLVALEDALYAAKIISYAQGYMLLQTAAAELGWQLDYGGIAQLWRGGCIIRSRFLGDIKSAYAADPKLESLLLAPFFAGEIASAQAGWRRAVAKAIEFGVPTPALSAGLAFYDGYRQDRLPANLLQAQRDYFGAHTYERVDAPRGEFFHTDWTGHGGKATSGSYDA